MYIIETYYDEYDDDQEIASLFSPSITFILKTNSTYSKKAIDFLDRYVQNNELKSDELLKLILNYDINNIPNTDDHDIDDDDDDDSGYEKILSMLGYIVYTQPELIDNTLNSGILVTLCRIFNYDDTYKESVLEIIDHLLSVI